MINLIYVVYDCHNSQSRTIGHPEEQKIVDIKFTLKDAIGYWAEKGEDKNTCYERVEENYVCSNCGHILDVFMGALMFAELTQVKKCNKCNNELFVTLKTSSQIWEDLQYYLSTNNNV